MAGTGLNPRAGITQTAPVQREETSRSASVFMLAGYIFLLTSLLHEYLSFYAHIQFPFVALTLALVGIPYLFSGKQFRFFESKFAIPWIILLGWWMIAGAVGFYRTRSFEYLFPYALRIHSLPLILCGLARDTKSVRRLLYGAGFGLLVVLAACAKWGTMSEDRFIIPDTSLGNANDLALRLLLTGSLFLVFWAGGNFKRVILILGLPVLIYFILKTGSRGNLVTVLCMGACTFLLLPGMKRKLMLLVASVGLVLVSLPFVPAETLHRLQTFMSVGSDSEDERVKDLGQHAVDSTNARLQLQWRAIQLTLQNPVFGVGPQNFADAVEEMVRSTEKIKSGWQVSHNSYLQVSSETGIPGFLVYTWMIGLCLVVNYRNFRRTQGAEALASFAIFLATLSYAVGILFCSIAYDYYLSLLVGLSAANELALGRARQSASTMSAAPARMVPAPAPAYSGGFKRRS